MCALAAIRGHCLTRPREKRIHNARAVFTLYALQGICTLVFSRLANDDFKYVASRQVKQVGILVGIEGGSPLFDKHGENSRARANRNLTRAQIRIQLGGRRREEGERRTNKRKRVSQRGKIPRRFGQSKREKWEPRITIPGFYPSMPSRLIPYLAIYGARNPCAGCVEIYRRILKIESLEEKKNWKGVFVLWKKFVRGFIISNFSAICTC